MNSPAPIMTPKTIYGYAAAIIEPHLGWVDQGPKCKVSTLLHLVFYAAAQRCSLAAACSCLRDAPSDQAARDALVALCPEVQVLAHQLNASFAAQRPKSVTHRPWCLAIDLNLRPYHGQPHRADKEVYRSQAKNGTTHLHAYATCYIVKNKRRYTVALTRVERGESMVTVLKRLLQRAARVGFRVNLLLLDRGSTALR